MMMASKSYKKYPAHKELYDALIQSLFVDEDDMDQAAAAANLSTQVKRKHNDQDEYLTARSDQEKEKKRPQRDTQPPKKSFASKEPSKDAEENIVDEMGNADKQPDSEAAPKADNAPRNNWFKQPPRPLTPDPEWNTCQNRHKLDKITKTDLVVPVYNLLKGICQSSIELEYNMEECFKALFDRLDWTNPKGDSCPYDLSKPLPLKGQPGHLTIHAEHFFKNDLEYLMLENVERKYTTSITKMKAARYELVRIEDMIQKSQIKRLSKHYVYSKLKILSVVRVKVDKQFGYGYLEEIVLFHLDGDVIVDLAVALRMFTIRIVIYKRVEYVQIGIESYQKKLNITKPQKDFPTIFTKELYTPSFDTPGVVYVDLSKRKRLMRVDELYKFSNGTLKLVRDTLHHRLRNFRMGYNKGMLNRKWSAKDQKRSGIMVKLIEEQLLERCIMGNLERLVGAREVEMDYRMM
ncbi:hypothetical protein Tco_1561206 [Tanacetum coccineum]